MKPLSVLIVDDEPLARDTIRLLLEGRDDFEITGECEDGDAAVEAIVEQRPDLVFLDIQMPGKNGFEVVAAVGPDNMPVTIFATAYDQFALQAFEANALDYLLKPFDDDRFEKALSRASRRIDQEQLGAVSNRLVRLLEKTGHTRPDESTENERPINRIMVKERSTLLSIKVEDIDWIEAAGDYIGLHVGKKNHLLRETMIGIEGRLDPQRFVRVHRSTIVNIDRIKKLEPYFHGDYIVYLRDGTELKVSRRYWNRLESILGSPAS